MSSVDTERNPSLCKLCTEVGHPIRKLDRIGHTSNKFEVQKIMEVSISPKKLSVRIALKYNTITTELHMDV